jgi:NADP-dependent 3-hydroxy acid dehydrogenase YdfG
MSPPNCLKNKTALITGATSGIGKACALALDALGVKLVLTGRSQEKLNAVATELTSEATLIELDVRDRAAVEANLANLEIDILINNAGLALGLEPIDAGSLEQWEEMIDANIKGLLAVSRAVIPKMRARDRGHIVNLGSIAGKMVYPGGNVYCATKHAVAALSEAMNIDLNGTAIRVSHIAPGAVQTEFSNTRFSGDQSRAEAVYAGYDPLRAEDIADLIVYVLSAPPHVNIQDTLIMPTAQRNPYIHHKEEPK